MWSHNRIFVTIYINKSRIIVYMLQFVCILQYLDGILNLICGVVLFLAVAFTMRGGECCKWVGAWSKCTGSNGGSLRFSSRLPCILISVCEPFWDSSPRLKSSSSSARSIMISGGGRSWIKISVSWGSSLTSQLPLSQPLPRPLLLVTTFAFFESVLGPLMRLHSLLFSSSPLMSDGDEAMDKSKKWSEGFSCCLQEPSFFEVVRAGVLPLWDLETRCTCLGVPAFRTDSQGSSNSGIRRKVKFSSVSGTEGWSLTGTQHLNRCIMD